MCAFDWLRITSNSGYSKYTCNYISDVDCRRYIGGTTLGCIICSLVDTHHDVINFKNGAIKWIKWLVRSERYKAAYWIQVGFSLFLLGIQNESRMPASWSSSEWFDRTNKQWMVQFLGLFFVELFESVIFNKLILDIEFSFI